MTDIENELLKVNLLAIERTLDELVVFLGYLANHIERLGGVIGRLKVASEEGITLSSEKLDTIILANSNILSTLRTMIKDYQSK